MKRSNSNGDLISDEVKSSQIIQSHVLQLRRVLSPQELSHVSTLKFILGHKGKGAEAVVWAHNIHLGDARATRMGR